MTDESGVARSAAPSEAGADRSRSTDGPRSLTHTPEPWMATPIHFRLPLGSGSPPLFEDGMWAILPAYRPERLPIGTLDHGNESCAPARAQAGEDAHRIVACVNALAGISTSDLEGGVIAEAREALSHAGLYIDAVLKHARPLDEMDARLLEGVASKVVAVLAKLGGAR